MAPEERSSTGRSSTRLGTTFTKPTVARRTSITPCVWSSDAPLRPVQDEDVRALVKTKAGPGLELVDVPEPECGDRDVKVRVLRAGLCGTDLHLQAWDDWAASTVTAPMTIGHEFFGEVVEVGADVEHVAVGDRVSGRGTSSAASAATAGRAAPAVHPHHRVGVNRDGAFADHVVIPATNAWVQPADLDPDLGALFDPLGNATHTAPQWPVVGRTSPSPGPVRSG